MIILTRFHQMVGFFVTDLFRPPAGSALVAAIVGIVGLFFGFDHFDPGLGHHLAHELLHLAEPGHVECGDGILITDDQGVEFQALPSVLFPRALGIGSATGGLGPGDRFSLPRDYRIVLGWPLLEVHVLVIVVGGGGT